MDPAHPGVEILIVEDDPAIRQALYDVLESEGYVVAAAIHGQDALNYLRTSSHPHPKLILLDLLMPVMDGYAFRTVQLQDSDIAAIPVVVLSAQSLSHDASSAIKAAFYLRKPIGVDQLLTIVDSYCQPGR
jgi:CheY-like chemotaxis protein